MLTTMFKPEHVEPDTVRRFTRGEYDRMVALGMFDDERLELLHGTLVTMSPQGKPHAKLTAWLARELSIQLGRSYDVRSHSPFAASADSEPEPDVSVQIDQPHELDHLTKPLLLIEVSDSSLRKDQQIKAPLYASAGVPEYWIVDISNDRLVIDVHTEPTAEGYRIVTRMRDGDVLKPARLPVEIRVDEIPWPRD